MYEPSAPEHAAARAKALGWERESVHDLSQPIDPETVRRDLACDGAFFVHFLVA